MFVFLTAAARTRIVTANLVRLYNCTGFLLLHVQFFTFLLCEDRIPLRKLIQPVCLGINHVLVKKFFIKSQSYSGVLIHCLDRVRDLKAVIDSVKKTNHSQDFLSVFLSQYFDCTAYNFVRIGKKLLVDSLLDIEIVCPESLELIAVCLLIVSN